MFSVLSDMVTLKTNQLCSFQDVLDILGFIKLLHFGQAWFV
jgi:hypothetical protein